MATPQHIKLKVSTAYNAAADYFDHPANSFWERFGRATVRRAGLRPGARVLDVCCGSGASALAAAAIAGPRGFVLGVDLAEHLLALARAKALRRGLHNTAFQTGDMLDLRLPEGSFDAVVCVFGIFFVPDVASAIRGLWRLVRPGGTLAITTWGPRFFEPVASVFWDSVREIRPELYRGFNPWDRICEPESLLPLMHEAGIDSATLMPERNEHAIPTPEAWWAGALGTGLRATLDALDPSGYERVRSEVFDYIARNAVTSVEANVLYAVATRERGDQPRFTSARYSRMTFA